MRRHRLLIFIVCVAAIVCTAAYTTMGPTSFEGPNSIFGVNKTTKIDGNGVTFPDNTLQTTAGGAACPVVNATNICLVGSPYFATTAGLTTTTAASIPSGSTSATVASCSTFLPGNGIQIPGAGAASALLIPTTVSCIGTTLVWTTATSTSVSSVTISHNDLNAWQAALNALGAAGGGNIYAPNGFSPVVGPLQDTAGCNCVLKLPTLPYPGSAPVQISIIGSQQPVFAFAGSTILTTLTSGNLIGGYDVASTTYGPFTNVYFSMKNMTVRDYANPGLGVLSLGYVVGARLEHVWIDTGGSGTAPTNSASFGIQLPFISNGAYVQLYDVSVIGQYNCLIFNEHSVGVGVYGSNCFNGFVFESSPSSLGGYSNSASLTYGWCQQCSNEVVGAGLNGIPVDLRNIDIEDALVHGVNDPNNVLKGYMTWEVPYTAGAVTPTNAAVNGAANLNMMGMDQSNITKGGANFEGQICPDTSAGAYTFITMNGICGEPTTLSLGGIGFEGSSTSSSSFWNIQNGGSFVQRIGAASGTTGYLSNAGTNLNAGGWSLLGGVARVPTITTTAYTVSTLPALPSAAFPAGAQVTVTDGAGTAPTCTGGGTTYQIAITNGTVWGCH